MTPEREEWGLGCGFFSSFFLPFIRERLAAVVVMGEGEAKSSGGEFWFSEE